MKLATRLLNRGVLSIAQKAMARRQACSNPKTPVPNTPVKYAERRGPRDMSENGPATKASVWSVLVEVRSERKCIDQIVTPVMIGLSASLLKVA